jgi:putative hydrolase of HD superfamily
MDTEPLIGLLMESMTLKKMPRTGWLMRGVPDAESVADHSFGVTFVSLVLCDALCENGDATHPLDREKVLVIALLHDLAEVRLTDLPVSAARLISAQTKSRAEAEALRLLLSPLSGGGALAALWSEFEERASPEGRLVRDADKLEMMVQCLRYEKAGSRGLQEYWDATDEYAWAYPLCAELYAGLRHMRQGGAR